MSKERSWANDWEYIPSTRTICSLYSTGTVANKQTNKLRFQVTIINTEIILSVVRMYIYRVVCVHRRTNYHLFENPPPTENTTQRSTISSLQTNVKSYSRGNDSQKRTDDTKTTTDAKKPGTPYYTNMIPCHYKRYM